MKEKKTILYTVSNNLCTGCGLCEDICPTNSISIQLKNGLYLPGLNATTCISEKGCNKCLKVCPGHSIDLKKRSAVLYGNEAKLDQYVGYYQSCYSGYSLNYNIRYHAASGGLLSQFLIFLLDKGIITGAVVTGFNYEDKITPKIFIATTAQEVISARSSKYCPVSMNKIGNELKKLEGKFVIVGLPCHIQGFRKRADIDVVFKQKVIGYFSIYCSSNRSFLATEYLFAKHKIKRSEICYFAYRDEGCLGSMKVEDKYGISKTIPYLDYYPGIRSFFKPERCLSCIDHYGRLADVCFGDIHIPPYTQDKIGINSVIVRESKFDKWLHQAENEGYISLSEIPANIVNASQKTMLYPKKRKVYALQRIDQFFGKEIVQYDENLKTKIGLRDIAGVFIIKIQRYIGKNKRLWFLIDLLSK